jgi:cob(I)alamin adenosyltransferase
MLYTRKGDSGTSGLFGTKERFSKDSPVYDALGTLDELNSLLGVCYAGANRESGNARLAQAVRLAQEHLFTCQAQLAGSDKHITQEHVEVLEAVIADLETKISNPHSFVVPGSTELSAWFDYARAVSRRAERSVVHISHTQMVPIEVLSYLNRLSSLLYTLARVSAAIIKSSECKPTYDVHN